MLEKGSFLNCKFFVQGSIVSGIRLHFARSFKRLVKFAHLGTDYEYSLFRLLRQARSQTNRQEKLAA